MNENIYNSLQVLFQKTHIEALVNNQKQISKWESYRKDTIEVQERLQLFLKDLNVPVMVPIGNKALFRGKLVHTNDITISLGDGYFVKGSVDQACEIISRRVTTCDEMLKKLEKERQLFESRSNLPHDGELFPSVDSREIMEEYKETEEEIWKKEHKKKVREYKRKLAQLKGDVPLEIKSDEDLWKKLEILEMEEELNDELDRLGNDSSSDGSDIDSSNNESDEEDKFVDSVHIFDHDKPDKQPPGANAVPQTSIIKKTHTPIKSESPSNDNSQDSDSECIRIDFKHSSMKPTVEECENIINSPYDIYHRYATAMKKNRKNSRRVSFADLPQVKMFKKETSVPVQSKQVPQDVPLAFGEVVERTAPSNIKTTESRPVSKFKSSRNKYSNTSF